MFIQVLDVSAFPIFKKYHDDVVEEYIDQNGLRSKIKLTVSESRVLCTRFIWSSWVRTLKSVDLTKAFRDIGYIWTDNSPISLRSLPGYVFDPTSIDCLSLMNDDYDKVDRIDTVADEAAEQQRTQVKSPQKKQLTLSNMWKNNK